MGYVGGYAFTTKAAEESKRRVDRYNELLETGVVREMELVARPKYAETYYSGKLPKNMKLSDEDILIICDRGNTCFGGVVRQSVDTFTATVYTD